MSWVVALISIALNSVGYKSTRQDLWLEPARRTLRASSSYWGTRNRRPPAGSTSLDASGQMDRRPDSNSRPNFLASCIGFPINMDPSTTLAWQPEGVTTDFWYPQYEAVTPSGCLAERTQDRAQSGPNAERTNDIASSCPQTPDTRKVAKNSPNNAAPNIGHNLPDGPGP